MRALLRRAAIVGWRGEVAAWVENEGEGGEEARRRGAREKEESKREGERAREKEESKREGGERGRRRALRGKEDAKGEGGRKSERRKEEEAHCSRVRYMVEGSAYGCGFKASS
ncbi:hypothetical protein KM043_003629 [Ampulex compressa]|nr:hypothetical protein KM043_003629 [Ampulex compressa]